MSGRLHKSLKEFIKSRFDHQLDTPEGRKKSVFFAKWIDLGFLRRRWTNDGKVTPRVWRSNNPTTERLDAFAQKGIKTIINLRHDVNSSPVKLELEQCEHLGLRCICYPMGPRRPPTRSELLGLIALFNSVDGEVLIHCKSGADRTGLASAIWLLTQEGRSIEKAAKELSIRYLHRRNSETGILDSVLDLYALAPKGQSFEEWVANDYDPVLAVKFHSENKEILTGFGSVRSLVSDLYKYAQHREAYWHASFQDLTESDSDKKRARFFVNWVDHGVLRHLWTNRAEISLGIYRSNHPTEARIRAEAKAGIKTFINLGGASTLPQYLIENDMCRELGITLVDLPMTAGRKPTGKEMQDLLDAFDTAERPLLVHCKSGADRTGLAAAAYLLDQSQDVKSAKAQLAVRFLHFAFGPKKSLDQFIDDYEADFNTTGVRFRDWIASLNE